MEAATTTTTRSLFDLLTSILPSRLLNLSALKDLYLSFFLLSYSLIPTTLTISTSTSTSIHMWVPRNPSSPLLRRRRKPALLLVHGFGGNSKWQFQHQIPALSRSFDLYIPDLLFFGRSATDSPDRSVTFQATCLLDAMRKLGIRKYSVAGISYGGFVAYRMAEMAAAEVVERVVIMTAGICVVDEEKRREMVAREERDVSEILLPQNVEDLRTLIRRSMYRPPKWIPAFLLQDFIQLMYMDRRKERVELLKDLLSKGVGMNPLPILKQETLLLWGDRDDVFPIDLAYELQSHLGPKARLEVIKDAGHALQLEKPNLVNYMIEWFLIEPYQNLLS